MATAKVSSREGDHPCSSPSSLKDVFSTSCHDWISASTSGACTCQSSIIGNEGEGSPQRRDNWDASSTVFRSCSNEGFHNSLDGMESREEGCEVPGTPPETVEPLVDPELQLPQRYSMEVPHVRQSYSWDCGLACVLMILQTLGVEGCSLAQLRNLCRTTSVWTVDLAFLLRHFKMEVMMLTITIGANPNYAGETFYKDNMRRDERRVNKLFRGAAAAGISLQRRSITGDELARVILSRKFLAIALLDKRKLMSLRTADFCLPDFLVKSSSYTGHYVVVCGYDAESKEFEIRDPANHGSLGSLTMQELDNARKAYGTDEDLLLVSLEAPHKRRKSE